MYSEVKIDDDTIITAQQIKELQKHNALLIENLSIRSYILDIYSKADKRLGIHKIAICLRHDYCINIKVIAYKVSQHIDTTLAINTLEAAMNFRANPSGIIFHTDRGSQFTSHDFMECFFKYLKKEEVKRRTYSTIGELNLSLFKYIEGFYNSVRPHSHNDDLSPNERERLFCVN